MTSFIDKPHEEKTDTLPEITWFVGLTQLSLNWRWKKVAKQKHSFFYYFFGLKRTVCWNIIDLASLLQQQEHNNNNNDNSSINNNYNCNTEKYFPKTQKITSENFFLLIKATVKMQKNFHFRLFDTFFCWIRFIASKNESKSKLLFLYWEFYFCRKITNTYQMKTRGSHILKSSWKNIFKNLFKIEKLSSTNGPKFKIISLLQNY